MKAVICSVLIFLFVVGSNSFAVDMGDWEKINLGVEGSPGLFCNIDSAEVCVIAITEEDCKKLEGKKVDACPASQSKE